jgi:hypothetical protein
MIYPAGQNQFLLACNVALEALIQGSKGIRLAWFTFFEY